MHQGIDGKTDEHYPAQPGDRQFMTLIQRANLARPDNAYENSVGQRPPTKLRMINQGNIDQCSNSARLDSSAVKVATATG